MAENRKALHVIADASGLTYERVKDTFFRILYNDPDSEDLTKDLVRLIQERHQP